jgi:peroxiredoxin
MGALVTASRKERTMALTPSAMAALGTAAPDFSLTDTVTGRTVSLADFKSKSALLVMFIGNHCPYVKHVQEGLVQLGKDYEKKDVGIVAISSNDPVSHPGDAPDKMAEEAKKNGYRFPYIHDETQAGGRAYRATCTPDFFLYDESRKLASRGQLDASRPGNGIPVTGKDLRAAIDALLAGKPVPMEQKASVGCNIKWRT